VSLQRKEKTLEEVEAEETVEEATDFEITVAGAMTDLASVEMTMTILGDAAITTEAAVMGDVEILETVVTKTVEEVMADLEGEIEEDETEEDIITIDRGEYVFSFNAAAVVTGTSVAICMKSNNETSCS